MREYTVLNPTLTVREDDEVPREWSTDTEKKKKEKETKRKREKKKEIAIFQKIQIFQLCIDSIITVESLIIR